MHSTKTDPLAADWSAIDTIEQFSSTGSVTAADVSDRLARLDVSDIGAATVPLLAAAAAELALVAGIPWRFSTDDPAVALLRVVARATLADPTSGGPHTERLAHHLSGLAASSGASSI